jgi:hypothetical protein
LRIVNVAASLKPEREPELANFPTTYEQALRAFLQQALPGAVLRQPFTYEIPGVWYMHAEVPGSGTTTLRITDAVIQSVPIQVALESLQKFPLTLDPAEASTLTLSHGPEGLEIRVDPSH